MKTAHKIITGILIFMALGFTTYQLSQEDQLIVGVWISEEDSDSKLVFDTNGKCKWYYTNESTSEYFYTISNKTPQCGKSVHINQYTSYLKLTNVINSEDVYCYEINGITESTLSLRFLGNGGFVTGIGGTTITLGGIDAGATRILMNPPIETDEEGTCPPGYAKNPVTDECISICNGGKVYNELTNECECPEDLTENQDGNCIENPCPGDPVFNPEIAPQLGPSGTKGALHGCTRYGSGCISPDGRNKKHNGLDLVNPYGAPIYAMYDGIATKVTQYKKDGVTVVGAGHYVSIASTVNGEDIKILYFHMQEDNRASGSISAGDIIGFQGDSGNLKRAIKQSGTVSHLHIKVKDSNNNPVDPRYYLGTEMDVNGNVNQNDNCN